MLAGVAVHQLGKKGFTHAGGAGQQDVQPVGIQYRGFPFFHGIVQAAIVADQHGERIDSLIVILWLRQEIGERCRLAFAFHQCTVEQRFRRPAM